MFSEVLLDVCVARSAVIDAPAGVVHIAGALEGRLFSAYACRGLSLRGCSTNCWGTGDSCNIYALPMDVPRPGASANMFATESLIGGVLVCRRAQPRIASHRTSLVPVRRYQTEQYQQGPCAGAHNRTRKSPKWTILLLDRMDNAVARYCRDQGC